MRPEQRIELMLADLRRAWLANPDQRLGQIIGNACRAEVELGWPYGRYRDPFNVEDDETWNGLRRLAAGDMKT